MADVSSTITDAFEVGTELHADTISCALTVHTDPGRQVKLLMEPEKMRTLGARLIAEADFADARRWVL